MALILHISVILLILVIAWTDKQYARIIRSGGIKIKLIE